MRADQPLKQLSAIFVVCMGLSHCLQVLVPSREHSVGLHLHLARVPQVYQAASQTPSDSVNVSDWSSATRRTM